MSSITRTPIQVRVPIISDKQNCCPYERPFGYIYLVTNLINGHMYIGKHEFHHPWLDKSYQGSGIRLWRAYKKYGMKNFDTIILEWTDKNNDELNRLETYWIEVFGVFNFSFHYNLTEGGDGASFPGESNPMYNNHRFAGENNPNYGKLCTEFCKEQTRKANTGRKDTLETTEKRRNSHLGEKNSMYNKGYKISGIHNPNYGKHLSDEHKLKISKARKGRFTGEDNPNYGNGYKISGKNNPRAISVLQLSLNGEVLREFSTMREASKFIGKSEAGIYDCCNGKQRTCGGFRWVKKLDYDK